MKQPKRKWKMKKRPDFNQSVESIPMLWRMIPVMFISLFVACSGPDDSTGTSSPGTREPTDRVVTVSYPLQFLTQRIAGDSIEVEFPVPTDATDTQHWRPTREAIGAMQSADLIIANGTGATYADWLTTVSLPESKIRNAATKGLALSDFIAVEDVTITHSHGPEGEHSHPTMVARTWLDPAMAQKQAQYIAKQLTEVYPDRSDEFADNLKALVVELDRLSERAKSIRPEQDNAVITATPRLKFLSRGAELGDRHLTWTEMPTVEQIQKDLTRILDPENEKASVILFDDVMPGEAIASILKDHGLTPVAIDLIDRDSPDGDYLTRMEANIALLEQALGKSPAESK